MKKEWAPIVILFLFLLLAFAPEKSVIVRYKCLDGSITNDLSLCPEPESESDENKLDEGGVVIIQSQHEENHFADLPTAPKPEEPRPIKLVKHAEQILDTDEPQFDPSLNNNLLAWVQYNGRDMDVHLAFLNSDRRRIIADSDFDERSPFVSQNQVAYLLDVTPLKPKKKQNTIMLYDVLLDETTPLVCVDGRKQLVDFDHSYLIYQESFLEQNVLIDLSLLRNWDCEEPKKIPLPYGEKPIKIVTRNYILLEPKQERECRILDTGTKEVIIFNLPCADVDEKLAVNELQYFDWKNFSTVYRYRVPPEGAWSYEGYEEDSNFVATDNYLVVQQLPDRKISSITYERPEYDLMFYDLKNREAVPVTKSMKTKEVTINGNLYRRDFSFDDTTVAWVDIRKDVNQPSIYVAKFVYG